MILSFITVQEVQPIRGAQDHSGPISVAGERVVLICTKSNKQKKSVNDFAYDDMDSIELVLKTSDENYHFFEGVRMAFDSKAIRPALDFVFSYIDRLIFERRFSECDGILGDLRTIQLDTRLIVAILMVTEPCKGRLKNRESLIQAAALVLSGKYESNEVERIIGGFR